MIESRLLLDYPYSQDSIALGLADKTRYQDQMQAHLDYVNLALETLSVANDYAQSFRFGNSLEAFRDYLISKAYLHSLRNVLYYDNESTELTAHLKRYTETSNRSALYPIADVSEQRMAGPIGTLANYFIFSDTATDPITCLENLLNMVWGMTGIPITLTPSERITKLNLLTGRREYLDAQVEALLNNLFTNVGPTDDDYNVLLFARRNMVSREDAVNYSRRVLTGDYNPALLSIIAALTSNEGIEHTGYASNCLSLLRPCGFNMLLQAFIVEGLVNAAKTIMALDPLIREQSLYSFLESSRFSSVRQDIASHLATSADALEFIILNDLMSGYEDDLDNLIRLTLMFTTSSVAAGGPTRLHKLYDTRELNKYDYAYNSSVYRALQQLAAVGPNLLTLSADSNFSNTVTYTATGPNGPLTIILIIADRNVDYNKVYVTNSTSREGNVTATIINQTDSPLVAAAITSSVDVGTTVTLEQYTSLIANIDATNPDSLSTSNVVVSSPSVTEYSLSEEINASATSISSDFYNYNLLTATSSPRGSVNTSYEAQGVYTSQLTAGQIGQLQLSKNNDYLDEYAARMAGLTSQQQQVHGQEIEALETWSAALRGIT